MHSRDTTVLVDLLWFNVLYYSSLFQYFLFWSTNIPTLVENSSLNILETIFMTDEPMHIKSKDSKQRLKSEVPNTTRHTVVWASAIKVATMKITDDTSVTNRSNLVATTKSTFFAVKKDEWDTKESTVKSLKNALYIQLYAYGKRHLLATLNNKKIKPVA